MDFSILPQVLPGFLQGTLNTIIYCAVSFPLALLLGVILALMSGSRYTWLRGPARIYIEVIRATPFIAQIFLIYYGLSTILFNLSGYLGGLNLAVYVNGWTAGIAALAINYSAYEAEVFRAGFYSVERGQTEAAYSLGLDARQNFFRIVFPQAIPLMIPPFVNDLIYMLKDSAVVSVIAGFELTSALETARSRLGSDIVLLFLIVMILYLALSLPTSYFARWYERKLRAAL
ncbi:MAG TPA: amino acid ABC transporter permease [Ktedonobacteraceae bacterium]|nr:amino acid ABC transporter permease [Ktedonobacteraceae bacterium]